MFSIPFCSTKVRIWAINLTAIALVYGVLLVVVIRRENTEANVEDKEMSVIIYFFLMATTSDTANITDAMNQFAEMAPYREAILPEIKEATEFAECCLGDQLRNFFADDSWQPVLREEASEAIRCVKSCASPFLGNRSLSDWVVNDTRFWALQDAEKDLDTSYYLDHVKKLCAEQLNGFDTCVLQCRTGQSREVDNFLASMQKDSSQYCDVKSHQQRISKECPNIYSMYDILTNVFEFGLPFATNFSRLSLKEQCAGYKRLVLDIVVDEFNKNECLGPIIASAYRASTIWSSALNSHGALIWKCPDLFNPEINSDNVSLGVSTEDSQKYGNLSITTKPDRTIMHRCKDGTYYYYLKPIDRSLRHIYASGCFLIIDSSSYSGGVSLVERHQV
ncbi:hypothetical protein Ddc_18104 [Ditylenchus destructor]|nr:hypothetical protein Ddc_18104 [Ditylenchus destructor]